MKLMKLIRLHWMQNFSNCPQSFGPSVFRRSERSSWTQNAIHINHIDKVSMHLLIPILIDPSLLHLYLTCKENKQKIHNSQTVQMCQRLLQLK